MGYSFENYKMQLVNPDSNCEEVHLDNPSVYKYRECYRDLVELNMDLFPRKTQTFSMDINAKYYRPNPTCSMLRESLLKNTNKPDFTQGEDVMTLSQISED